MPDQQNPLGGQQVTSPPVDTPASSGPQPFPEMTDMPVMQNVNPMPPMETPPQPIDQPQASGPTDIPPIVESTKTPKRGGGKLFATILGLFLLIGAVGAGVVLVQQNQDIREKAANACGDIGPGSSLNCPANCPKIPYGGSATVFQCSPTPSCALAGQECNATLKCCSSLSCINGLCAPAPAPPQPTVAPVTCSSGQLRCRGNVSEICTDGYWRTNRECLSNQTCTNGNCVTKIETECSSNANCADTHGNTDYNIRSVCENGKCVNESSCTPVASERCVPGAFQGRDRIDVCTSDSWVTNVICPVGQMCCKVPPPPTSGMEPPYFECKTSCDGGSAVVVTPTPTPPPPGPSASCQSVKAYDEEWNPLTSSQLSALAVGSVVRFTVSGNPVASIDKARFTITATGATTPVTQSGEITAKKPSSDEYYYEYTIPAGTTAVSVTAQIHHATLNWF